MFDGRRFCGVPFNFPFGAADFKMICYNWVPGGVGSNHKHINDNDHSRCSEYQRTGLLVVKQRQRQLA